MSPSAIRSPQLGGDAGETTTTWVRDWIYPMGQSNPAVRLMGWFTAQAPLNREDSIIMDPKDILDLSNYENKLELPISAPQDTDQPVPEPTQEQIEQNKDLGQAISFNKDEGQISGLG